MPMEEAMRRPGSLVAISASTTKVTSPASSAASPSSGLTILQPGGKIDETRTMLRCAIPAFLSAISKLFSFSLLIPTPRVRNNFRGTNLTSSSPVGEISHRAAENRTEVRCVVKDTPRALPGPLLAITPAFHDTFPYGRHTAQGEGPSADCGRSLLPGQERPARDTR